LSSCSVRDQADEFAGFHDFSESVFPILDNRKVGIRSAAASRAVNGFQFLVAQLDISNNVGLVKLFLSTLLSSLKRGFSSASFAVFRIDLDKHGSFVI
jgi:hypothetical protein